MEQSRRKGGRPPTRQRKAGERVPLGLRVSVDLKNKLDQASLVSGRSQSQEAELRLEQSFMIEDRLLDAWGLLYGPSGRDLMRLIGVAIRHAPTSNHDWLADSLQYELVAESIIALLSGKPVRPPGEGPMAPGYEGKRAKGTVLRAALREVVEVSGSGFDAGAAARIVNWVREREDEVGEEK
jgi:hypothetical protein